MNNFRQENIYNLILFDDEKRNISKNNKKNILKVSEHDNDNK